MKVLLTGKKGKWYEALAGAFPSAHGFQVKAVPIGARVLEALHNASFDALVFALRSEPETEPLRWIVQENPSLPVVAVIPNRNTPLEKQLWEEGAAQVVDVQGLSPAQIRRALRQNLQGLAAGPSGKPGPDRPWTQELHEVRSSLTAILGNAEMVLPHMGRSPSTRTPLEEIIQEVAKVEKILRRMERRLKPSGRRAE